MTRAHRFTALLIAISVVPPVMAEHVPGRYIVELSTDSVTQHFGSQARRMGMRSSAANTHRATIRAEQRRVGAQFGPNATVLDSVDTVANALFVQIPDEDAGQLASIPGVRRVRQMRTFHMVMDRAVNVIRVPQAWDLIGLDKAGAGVKIAIVDSGIDAGHASFQDSSLIVPDSFPKAGRESDLSYTNNKVIVARSYVNLLTSRDPDQSPRDHIGHGTALAMVAAGVRNTGLMATVMGIAPRAYVGNYKVFGTPGYSDGTNDAAILKAIDDATADGMDIINLSLGDDLAPRLDDDIEVDAIERATRAGVIVVVAAGNNGPGVNTIASPATAPSAISVGASWNERVFAGSVEVEGIQPLVAIPSDRKPATETISGRLVNVLALDGSGLACGSLPENSLTGAVALILRGSCTFETKLNNAQKAGAVAAIIYAASSAPDPFEMSVQGATLPAEMIGYEDGTALSAALGGADPVTATLKFTISPVTVNSNRLAGFSAKGPNVDASIKPDLVAVGTDVYVATQTMDPSGDMYSQDGYITVDGTSFSSPMVAGVAALLKSARPGLTVDQYRSLIINSASPINAVLNVGATVQQAGAGLLNAGAAVQSTVTAFPAQLNYGKGGPDPKLSRTLRLTNVGANDESYTVLLETPEPVAPLAETNTVTLAPGQSAEIPILFEAVGLSEGAHEGVVRISASTSGTEARVPYWYAVTSSTPAYITVLRSIANARRGSSNRGAVYFRISDASGLPIDFDPEVTVVAGGGAVQSVVSYDRSIPGMMGLNLRLGPLAGSNTFQIKAGNVTAEVSITGQ